MLLLFIYIASFNLIFCLLVSRILILMLIPLVVSSIMITDYYIYEFNQSILFCNSCHFMAINSEYNYFIKIYIIFNKHLLIAQTYTILIIYCIRGKNLLLFFVLKIYLQIDWKSLQCCLNSFTVICIKCINYMLA